MSTERRGCISSDRLGKATLYVVDQNKIPLKDLLQKNKTEVVNTAGPIKTDQTVSRSVEYSISQIIPFGKSKDLLRYIPDSMLDVEQRKAKWEAIAETIKKTHKKNEARLREMLEEAARVVYHQTDADFNIFDVKHKGAGTSDSDTPFGIFLKPTDADIGLNGKKQIKKSIYIII